MYYELGVNNFMYKTYPGVDTEVCTTLIILSAKNLVKNSKFSNGRQQNVEIGATIHM